MATVRGSGSGAYTSVGGSSAYCLPQLKDVELIPAMNVGGVICRLKFGIKVGNTKLFPIYSKTSPENKKEYESHDSFLQTLAEGYSYRGEFVPLANEMEYDEIRIIGCDKPNTVGWVLIKRLPEDPETPTFGTALKGE